MVQELEVLGGSQLVVSAMGQPPHKRIKIVVVRRMRVAKAVGEGRREQGIVVQPAAQEGCDGIRTVKVPQATNARRRRRTAALHDHVGQTQKGAVPMRLGRIAIFPELRTVQSIRQDPAPAHNTINARLHTKAVVVVWRPTSGVTQIPPKQPNVISEGRQGAAGHGLPQHLAEHIVPAGVVVDVQ